MPRSTATGVLAAPAQEIWELICDPHHLPRWWPRVERVEAVDADAFTEVLRSDRGRLVRADFRIVQRDEQAMRVVFSQQVAGTPFATVLSAAETELRLRAVGENETEVSIALDQTLLSPFTRRAPGPAARGVFSQRLSGLFANLGGFMVRRAARATVKEALDGLQRIAVG